MRLVRRIGAVCLAVWAAGMGERAYRRLCRRCTALTESLILLRRIRQEIAFLHTDREALLAKLCAEGLCPPPRTENGENSLPEPPEGLAAGEERCFFSCMRALGRTNAAQECEKLDYTIARMEEYSRQAEEERRRHGPLVRRLGWAAALALAVLFW